MKEYVEIVKDLELTPKTLHSLDPFIHLQNYSQYTLRVTVEALVPQIPEIEGEISWEECDNVHLWED